MMQGVARCCRVLQYVAVCCSVLQCVTVCFCVLQCVAVFCRVLQCVAVCSNLLHKITTALTFCSVLQCVAVCCNVLQCVAVCSDLSHKITTSLTFKNIYQDDNPQAKIDDEEAEKDFNDKNTAIFKGVVTITCRNAVKLCPMDTFTGTYISKDQLSNSACSLIYHIK